MRLLELLRKTVGRLEAAGIDDALPDAETLVFHAVGMDRLDAYLKNPEIKSSDSARVVRLLRRRLRGEPVQYIVGHIEFLGLTIKVGRGVLIPRPETELLLQEVVKTVKSEETGVRGRNSSSRVTLCASRFTPHHLPSILDLCTGSGCIALALAREFPHAEVFGTDVSKEALAYAKKNAGINGIKNVSFLRGSLFNPVKGKKFDIITANPPYIRRDEIRTLQREIRDWEPLQALDGGEDGLNFYCQILSAALEYLNPGGNIFLELGYGQAGAVQDLAKAAGLQDVSAIHDYSGVERILKGSAQSSEKNPAGH
jgi:release factor glutamine methyltransferase